MYGSGVSCLRFFGDSYTMDIFLATGPITQESLFLNGLHQNSLTLYTLIERLG